MGTTGSLGLGYGLSVRRDLNYRKNLMVLLQVLYMYVYCQAAFGCLSAGIVLYP